ncbi:MAG: hypothetical protein L6W00_24135 [Lentisphaeria bacterium]|nr:MAG: hypothetical protein L6W00_24135 [Lentisphaeria bacterium]
MTGEADVESGLRQVFRFPAVKYAAITDGPDNAYASDGRTLAVYHLPPPERGGQSDRLRRHRQCRMDE